MFSCISFNSTIASQILSLVKLTKVRLKKVMLKEKKAKNKKLE